MKRVSFVFILIGMLTFGSYAFAQMVGIGMPTDNTYAPRSDRDVPEYSVLVTPTSLLTNFYDYMPGSYNGTPIQVQPAISQTMGYAAGGAYLVFHAQETANATRRAYWAYVDEDGTVTNYGYIGSTDMREGYPSVIIDPYSANPFAAYHLDYEGDDLNEDVISSDGYALLGSPGLWSTPAAVIDDSIEECHNVFPRDDNYYVWPYLSIGPSPLGDPYKRLYMIANNNQVHETGFACNNPLIAFADYDSHADMYAPGDYDWTYVTIPELDAWDCDDPDFNQGNHAMVVSPTDGTVAIVGYDNMDQNAYAAINTNYGEGTWDFYQQDMHFFVDNPQNQNGTYVFLDGDTPYTDLQFTFTRSHHFSATLSDTDVVYPCHFALRHNNEEDDTFNWWYSLVFGKVIHFDLTTRTFSFQDLYPTGADPSDNNVMIPWDLDEDGVVDEFNDEGSVLMAGGWPIYHWDQENAGYENNWKIVSNPQYDWMAIIWQEGLNCRYANDGYEGYESWDAKPEVRICISNDDGATWSEPIIFHANPDGDEGDYMPELSGMIPEYVYGGDVIEYLYTDNDGNAHGKLHLMFLDDNTYGSYVQNVGPQDGGMMKYMALDINFGNSYAVHPDEETKLATLQQNWPNPFNPETTIGYSLANPAKVQLDVYNVRGQHVKTLYSGAAEAGDHSAVWSGRDESGAAVASGMYFYRLSVDGESQVKKMLLLK